MAHGLETLKALNAAAEKRQRTTTKCVAILPINRPNGTKFSKALLNEIMLGLGRIFGGYTIDEVEGYFASETKEILEPGLRVTVVIPTNRVIELRNVLLALKSELQQDTLYFETSLVNLELL